MTIISSPEYSVIFNTQKATDTVPQSTVDSSSVLIKAESFYSKGRKYTVSQVTRHKKCLMNSFVTFYNVKKSELVDRNIPQHTFFVVNSSLNF